VQLAAAVARVPGLEHSGALMTIADDRLTVRLTRGIWQLERRHLDLARGISAVARRLGPSPTARARRRFSSPSRRSPAISMLASGAPPSDTYRWAKTTLPTG
jgi:hypothetical protein